MSSSTAGDSGWQIVVTLPGSANRDERHHTNPDSFDITKTPGQYFTFSFGPHYCLGASLAKLEGQCRYRGRSLSAFNDWSVDYSGAALTSGIDTRGWDCLPVKSADCGRPQRGTMSS